ncbi:unnamed protein product [Rotaria sordida]|uniref:Uncharacterized protein n=1 Tax=Rotaria sordida TaxID=392033 RepID=A0A815UMM3_9BILA|nr:unnamed protein product [Rotaria sordida]CAF4229819.1 unnamed protein product [Rotaria sordida]
MPNIQCSVCNNWKNSSELKSLSSSNYSWYHNYLSSNDKKFNINELFFCKGCKYTLYTIKKDLAAISISDPSSLYPESMEVEDANEGLTLDHVTFISSDYERCVVCPTLVSPEMVLMPKSARLDLLLLYRLFAARGVHCCRSHLLYGDRLRPDQHIDIENRLPMPTSLSTTQARELFNDLFSLIDTLKSSSHLDFDDPSLTNEDYEAWTGWTIEQFNLMFECISSHLRSSSNRTKRNCFAMFWIKLKTNLSFRQIGSLFNVPGDSESRRKRAADAFDSVRELLISHFVSKHLGIGHLTVDDAKTHNTAYTKVCSS